MNFPIPMMIAFLVCTVVAIYSVHHAYASGVKDGYSFAKWNAMTPKLKPDADHPLARVRAILMGDPKSFPELHQPLSGGDAMKPVNLCSLPGFDAMALPPDPCTAAGWGPLHTPPHKLTEKQLRDMEGMRNAFATGCGMAQPSVSQAPEMISLPVREMGIPTTKGHETNDERLSPDTLRYIDKHGHAPDAGINETTGEPSELDIEHSFETPLQHLIEAEREHFGDPDKGTGIYFGRKPTEATADGSVMAQPSEAPKAADDSNTSVQWIEWTDKTGGHHAMPLDGAKELIKRMYDEWPGGLEEIEVALKLYRSATESWQARAIKAEAGIAGLKGAIGAFGMADDGSVLVPRSSCESASTVCEDARTMAGGPIASNNARARESHSLGDSCANGSAIRVCQHGADQCITPKQCAGLGRCIDRYDELPRASAAGIEVKEIGPTVILLYGDRRREVRLPFGWHLANGKPPDVGNGGVVVMRRDGGKDIGFVSSFFWGHRPPGLSGAPSIDDIVAWCQYGLAAASEVRELSEGGAA